MTNIYNISDHAKRHRKPSQTGNGQVVDFNGYIMTGKCYTPSEYGMIVLEAFANKSLWVDAILSLATRQQRGVS